MEPDKSGDPNNDKDAYKNKDGKTDVKTLSEVVIKSQKNTSTERAQPVPQNSIPKANFKVANKYTSNFEGGWSNKQQDPGGATMRGIIFNNFKVWAQPDLGIVPTIDNLKNLTESQASILYKKHYWSKISGDDFEDGNVAFSIYDFSVQSGQGIKQVEKRMYATFGGGITVNGKLTKEEVTLLNKVNGRQLFHLIQDTRLSYVHHVIKMNVNAYFKTHPLATLKELQQYTLLGLQKGLENRVNNIKYKTSK